eukprot:gene10792-11946_t
MFEAYATISVLIVIVNSVEIILLMRARKKLKPCEQYLLSLSIADLSVGISTLWMTGVYPDAMDKSSKIKSQMTKSNTTIPIWFSEVSSILHVSAMTIDRIYAVRKPLEHRIKMTKKFVAKIIIALWMLTLVVLVLCLISPRAVRSFQYFVAHQIPLTTGLLIVAYSYIIYKSTRYNRNRVNVAPSSSTSLSSIHQKKKERNLISMCFMIAFSFLFLNMPFYIIETAKQTKGWKEVVLLLICNSLVNPLIYFFWKYMEKKLSKFATGSINYTPRSDNVASQQIRPSEQIA